MRQPSAYMKKETQEEIWSAFAERFKNKTSIDIYFGDINECMDICKKDFTDITQADANEYYHCLLKRVKEENLQMTTMKKKIKELHKFSDFIVKNRENYSVPAIFDNFFYRYAVEYFSDEELKKVAVLPDVDKLFDATKDNLMLYTILAIVYRIGLKSTEICSLKEKDVIADPKGVYLIIRKEDKQKVKYVPEDVSVILDKYMGERESREYLFYNQWGKKLNTQYLHRKMRELSQKAGTINYSLQDIRNACGCMMFAYGATKEQVSEQLGITTMHIKRYDQIIYGHNLEQYANSLVHIKIELPTEKK